MVAGPKIELREVLSSTQICNTSSIVDVMCLSRLIALFGRRMSTQIIISSGVLGFGATIIGETQGVGPSVTFLIHETLKFLLHLFRMWKGVRLCGWDVGLTDSSR